MTWTADERQLITLNDGAGWVDPPDRFFKRSLWSISGDDPRNLSARIVEGFPAVEQSEEPEDAPHYHGHGLLAVRGRVYQFLIALDQAQERPRHWTTAKLIYSDDGGRSWRNQDGSAPVRWESWDEQESDKFAFFNEPGGCFSLLTILQMGQDYRANRDGYIYVYGTNGNVDGQMNELVLFRVGIDDILDRRAYRFFAGLQPDGSPLWSETLDDRRPVHVFPRGWVNSTNLFPGDLVVETWLPSIVYNQALDVFMMVSSGNGCADDGTEFGKPSYLGFWISKTPWGPWRQIHEERAWTPGGDPLARAYSPQIGPQWISADGKSFWLVWSDLKGIREIAQAMNSPEAEPPAAKTPQETALEANTLMRSFMPGYGFNAQLVELDVE
ncbi:MAG: DUF4185 domain-containing protein [Alphaproteobacteria bacterium]|nr:DUF4185 domain-containing protein [Alphaproteobacteria bacterium]MBU0794555.1 DUF4185 domain-containing protein [Alphaproteobacteria bacterium]MBU0877053.1 DUF4185 domain-containing protein [Alphaproteobacteria bacterium]MBU1768479.1 DUF4185 domain-containing protein [Alphaproteobacteria bacterium]